MHTRKQLRKTLRAQRLALTPQEHLARSRRIAGHILRCRFFLRSRRIALYLPVRGEADPRPLIDAARRLGKEVCLPVLSPLGDGRLWFMAYHAHSLLRPNRFGIPEPVHTPRDRRMPRQLDLVIVPLVGFDARGNRLGTGGGFYDRSFAFLTQRRRWRRPLMIGYAFGLQEVDRLPAEAWDVPLDGIATEDRLILLRSS